MRLINALVAATLAQSICASALPSTDKTALETRTQPESQFSGRSIEQGQEELWKRKGGGGGGGRGGGSSGGGRGSSGSGTTSGGGRGSSGSNTGGRTTTGSGPKPAYGPGGAFYAGGARVPYRAGTSSPSGVAPFLLAGAGLGFLGGAYLVAGGAYYMYPYHHQYYYHNATTDRNETRPVVCTCREDGVCSCDDNGDQEYFNSIIGDGSYEGLNKSVVDVFRNETDGRTYIYINGTLPNGTTADGGTEDPNAGAGLRALVRVAGWWPVVTTALVLACTL